MTGFNLADIVADAERQSETFDTSPMTQTSPSCAGSSNVQRVGDSAIQEADLQHMIGEAQRNVRLQSGIVGQVLGKLRGDDLQRRQYKTMLTRIDGFNMTEEAKLALMLVVSLQVLGFKVAVSGMEEMEHFLGRFDPRSIAAGMGREMLQENRQILKNVAQDIAAQGRNRTARTLGVGH